MSHDKQSERRRRQLLKTAYLTAVLAGCAINTANYAQADTKEWRGTTTNYSTGSNWVSSGVPGNADQAVFGTQAGANTTVNIGTIFNNNIIGTTVVTPTAGYVDHVHFSGGANAQAFNLQINSGSSLTVNGNSAFSSGHLGVVNDSGLSQTFNVNGGTQTRAAFILGPQVGGGTLNFDGDSTITNIGVGSQVFINTTGNAYGAGTVNFNGRSSAGDANVTITNAGGGTTNFNHSSKAGSATIINNNGGLTNFNSTDATEYSSADSANITNNVGGNTEFNGYATAGSATITNDGGVTTFNNQSNAGTGTGIGSSPARATIINKNAGYTEFNGIDQFTFSSAGTARITNNATSGTEFNGWATAGSARITNDGGVTNFNDNSKAGDARITNNTATGRTTFSGDSKAENARIRNNDFGSTHFEDNSKAGDARIFNYNNGETHFEGSSQAENARIFNSDGGETHFEGSSQANNAFIVNGSGGSTQFHDTSQGNTATIVNNGVLQNDVANLTLGHVRGSGIVYNNGNLTLDSTGTSNPNRNDVISGTITGAGGLTKEGENIVRLTGNNTYTGATTINNGVLSLPGSITSDTTINAGGELRGNGTIGDNVTPRNLTNNGGRLVTGDAFGGDTYSALSVTGNFSVTDANSVFVSRVGSNSLGGYNNSLSVNGSANLGGVVEVHVDQTPGTIYYVNNEFLLVGTGTGRSGTFTGVDTVNSDLPTYLSLAPDTGYANGLTYDSYNAYLVLRRNTLDDLVDGVHLTRNQRAAFNSLNNVNFNNLSGYQEDVIDEFIYSTAYAGAGTASSLLSGDALTAYQVAAQGASNRFNQRLISQIFSQAQANDEYASLRTPRLVYTGNTYRTLLAQGDGAAANAAQAASANRSSVWATIARAKEDTDSDGNGPGFDARATEYQVGYNRKLSGRTVLGLSIGKSDGDIKVDDRAAKGDLDTTSFGAYLRHDSDDLYFSGLLSYSRHNIDSRRWTSPFDTAHADYDARTIALWGEVGKKVERGSLAIEPHLSLKLSNTKQDSFSESGFGGLDVDSQKYNTRRLGLGVRVATNSATAKFRPYGFVGYEREFGDERAELTNSVAGLSSFNVRGSELGKNIWALRLGTDARISDRFSVVGEIGASWRKNQDSRYVYGGVKYGW